MMEINFTFTFRLHQYQGDDGNQFYIYIQITTIPRRRWNTILYLHLDYNKTMETMEINFTFTFRLQQCHGDGGNQFYIYIQIKKISPKRWK